MPLRPRGGISRASFPSALPISFLAKEEAERRTAHVFIRALTESAPALRSRSRLTTLHCGVETVGHSASAHCQGYYPLALARRRDGQVIRSPLVGWGAFSTCLPGHGFEAMDAGAASRSRSVA